MSEHDIPARDRLVLAWVAKVSRSLVDLHDPVLSRNAGPDADVPIPRGDEPLDDVATWRW